jgi:hypothetical protein
MVRRRPRKGNYLRIGERRAVLVGRGLSAVSREKEMRRNTQADARLREQVSSVTLLRNMSPDPSGTRGYDCASAQRSCRPRACFARAQRLSGIEPGV